MKNILQIYNFDVTAKRFLTKKCLLQNVQIPLRKLGRTIEALPNAQTAENAELNSNNLEQNLVLPHSSLKESNIQKTGVWMASRRVWSVGIWGESEWYSWKLQKKEYQIITGMPSSKSLYKLIHSSKNSFFKCSSHCGFHIWESQYQLCFSYISPEKALHVQ